MRQIPYLYSLTHLFIFVFSLLTDWYGPLVISLNVIVALMMIDKLGKGIVLRETMALYMSFICLLMPLIGYAIYNNDNILSKLYVRYMFVPESVYFNYALPAVAGYILFLCWPLSNSFVSDQNQPLRNTIHRVKENLIGNQKLGIALLTIGTIVIAFVNSLPASLQYIFSLLSFSSFAGFLYVYFSNSFPLKYIILISFGLFIISLSIGNGMFTIVAYMGMTLYSFFFLGNKSPLWKKLLFFILGALFLIIIQNVKPTYRKEVWKKDYAGDKTSIFINLIIERISEPSKLISSEAFFPLYYRANQGYNVALVMKRYPNIQPYDNGDRLFLNIASSFVPRLLWPDKPEAGGVANMKYYTGIAIKGWSTNVGPLGEAYGSFGVGGGIVYMMLLGMFIRFAYLRVFVIANRIPLIILWIPVLFYQVTYAAENDSLQILNSLIKSSFFLYILYKVLPFLFKPKPLIKKNEYSIKADKLQTQ